MEFLNKGNECYVLERYNKCIEYYTKAVRALDGNQRSCALFGRGRCYMIKNNNKAAIIDFKELISLKPDDILGKYYYGYCIINEYKKDLNELKKAYNVLSSIDGDERFVKALDKCKLLLNKLGYDPLLNGNDQDNDVKMNNNIENNNNNNNSNDSNNEVKNDFVKPDVNFGPLLKESWYQTQSNINITIYVKKVPKNDVTIDMSNNRIKININLPNNAPYNGQKYQRIFNLTDKINVNESKYSISSVKVNLVLKKEVNGEWNSLESNNVNKIQNNSLGTKAKNWKKIEEYAAQELAKDKPEGDEALNELFQKIYADADDDQRRAMIKSFQTSNGTVLSTNWSDVKKKDYEGKDKVEPTGATVKKYEY